MKKFPKAVAAVNALKKTDPILKKVIEKVGSVKIELDTKETVFESLATSIIYQQLHGKAAATILKRFIALFDCVGGEFPEPDQILEVKLDYLRSAGLSQNKALAIQDLARKAQSGRIPDRKKAETMSDEELIEAFSQVRGVGEWTAQMLLIFTFGRQDVLPTGDYGVRKGFATVYKKRDLPTPKQLSQYAEKWRPYRSVASWYMWRALDLEKI